MDDEKLKDLAKAVLNNEANAITELMPRIDETFITACQILINCDGRVIVMGMGKSGHIGGKIAATLASTGSPAFFVHPGEASHGDMGMITENDVVFALSNSGETKEILTLLPLIKRLGTPLISLTGNPTSTLARAATAHIDVSVKEEACPLGLAPTTSSTAALAMGDALAISLLEIRGFTANDFALSHPGGQLGRRLLLRNREIMHTGDDLPMVADTATLGDALLEMSNKHLGMTTVVDKQHMLCGVFTDGDLRRVLDHGQVDVHTIIIKDVMTKIFRTATPDMLVEESLQMMQKFKINSIPIVDHKNQLVGAMNMHDLLLARVI